MTDIVTLKGNDLERLNSIITYILDTEGDSYDQFIRENGKENAENHIMHDAILLNRSIRKQNN